MNRKRATLFLAVVAVLALVMVISTVDSASGDRGCEYYWDSDEDWEWGYGTICAGSGPGCQVCYNSETGQRCTSGVPYRCRPFQDY